MINIQQIEDQNKLLLEKFTISRKEWSTKLDSIIKMLSDITKITELEVLRLSYRHMIVDTITDLNILIYKKQTEYSNYYKQLYINYKTNYNLKLNQSETDKFIESDLSEFKKQIYLIENHVYFFKECIKTVDNIAYAIKNKIQIIQETIK